MELLKYHLPTANKPFCIAPLGDLQWNGHAKDVWGDGLKRHIDWALSQNAYFLGMGDYIDFASPSSRSKLLSSGAYEGPMQKLDDVALELTHQVYEQFLKPTKGRWIGMLEGHHFWQMKDGTTTDMRLCEMLKTTHLGTEAIVEFTLPRLTGGTGIGSFQIWCVDDATEALTKRGWVSHGALNVGDEILAFDPITNSAVWQPMLNKVAYQYDGAAIPFTWRGREVALTVPEHRWWAGPAGSFREITSAKWPVGAKHWRLPMWESVSSGLETVDDAFVRLVGWCLAEGTLRERRGGVEAVIYQNADSPYYEELLALTERFEGSVRAGRPNQLVFYIPAKVARQLLGVIERTPHKVPTWDFLWSLSTRQVRLLADAIYCGDGYRVGATRILVQHVQSPLQYRLQAAMTTAGVRTSLVSGSPSGFGGEGSMELSWCTSRQTALTRQEERAYSGIMWCPTVPSGYWLARKNGFTYVTGNCHHGVGGGEESALLMKLKKIAADWDNVLAFFMGHMTRLATTVIPKIEAVFSAQHAELIERRVLLVGTGGWSKGKVVSSREGQIPRGGYVEKKMMRPVSLGAPLVKCYPAFTKRGLPDKWGNKHKYFNPELEVVNR